MGISIFLDGPMTLGLSSWKSSQVVQCNARSGYNHGGSEARPKTLGDGHGIPRRIDHVEMCRALRLHPGRRIASMHLTFIEPGIEGFSARRCGAFADLLTSEDANETAAEFWRAKLREIVHDPATAELLTPDEVFGCKRLCAGTDYYETYNLPNVTLVDVSATGIERFTARGLRAAGRDYDFDAIICATGFDAMTGSVTRINITGAEGQSIQDKWRGGPSTFLGMTIAGFPNMFNIAGPGSPSVLATMVTCIEQHGEWIVEALEGSFTNVVGLPVERLLHELTAWQNREMV